jgi:zinc protease
MMGSAVQGGMVRGTFAVVAVAAGMALAQEAEAQQLPEASAIIARYQEAIGGKDALARHSSMQATGELSMPAQGITASLELVSARPNRTAMRVSIAGLGDIRSGFTGEHAWSLNPMEGPRLLQGAEKEEAMEQGGFDASLRLASHIQSAETVERTTMGGRPCIKVRLTWASGRTTYDCYSEETGLLVGSSATRQSSMGTVEAVSLYDDYRDFGGVRMPSRITVQTVGMEQVITYREVTFDAVPDSAFEVPAEVRGLIR